MKRAKLLTILVVSLLVANLVYAADAAPQKINYQGLLKDSNGDPVTGTVSMTFKIYDAAAGGTVLWQETHTSVALDEGRFAVILGEGDARVALGDDVFDTSECWLGITVGADPELTPRAQLVSVPYSQRVSTVDRASAGVISGTLEIETESAKDAQAGEAKLLIRGDFNDSVMLAPSDDIALYATDDNGDVVLAAGAGSQGGTVQVFANASKAASPRYVLISPGSDVAFRATSDNGDDLIMMTAPNTGGAIEVNASDAAKTLTRSVEINPANNVVLSSTEQNGDQTVAITSGPQGGVVQVAATDVAKGLSRTVDIAPAQNVILRAKELNGDDVLLLSASETGGSIEVNQSDALKGITSSVKISPSDNLALVATDANDSALVKISTSDSEGSISLLSSTAKGWEQIKIGRNAIYFFGANRSDTNMIITADGSIKGKGRLSMGGNHAESGAWGNVMGYNNSATGDSSVVCGGYDNTASGPASNIGGGSGNIAMSTWSTVGGGVDNMNNGGASVIAGGCQNQIGVSDWVGFSTISGGGFNTIDSWSSFIAGGGYNVIEANAPNSAILAGFSDTIATGARYSVMIGLGGKVTQDSTFMVDMPHIHFGDEYTGYEFPASDGSAGQYLATDGNGVLSWASLAGFRENLKLGGNWLSNDGGDEGVYVAADGNVGIGTDSPGSRLSVSGLTGTSSYNNVRVNTATGDFYYETSTERNKENITPLEEDFEKIFLAQPKAFNDKASGQREIGFLAEEFDALGLTDLVIYDADGRPNGLRYERISLYLLEVLKDKSDRLAHMESKLAQFEVLLQQLIEKQQ